VDVDVLNERIMHEVNAGGEVFLSHTRLAGRYAIRLSIGNIRTTREHVTRAWTLVLEAATRAADRA
jgi:aromatic-L-amino-acid decarboxylase